MNRASFQMTRSRQMRQALAVMVTLGLLALTTPSWAEPEAEESTVTQIGTGVGSVVGSAVYFPFKAAFGNLGRICSGCPRLAGGTGPPDRAARFPFPASGVITQ